MVQAAESKTSPDTKILAFRLPVAVYDDLMKRVKSKESKSKLLRRVVGDFLKKVKT